MGTKGMRGMHVEGNFLTQNSLDQVVEGGSVLMGDARERRDTIYADYDNIAKFSNPTDDGYKKILHAIKVLLEENRHSRGQSTSIYSI